MIHLWGSLVIVAVSLKGAFLIWGPCDMLDSHNSLAQMGKSRSSFVSMIPCSEGIEKMLHYGRNAHLSHPVALIVIKRKNNLSFDWWEIKSIGFKFHYAFVLTTRDTLGFQKFKCSFARAVSLSHRNMLTGEFWELKITQLCRHAMQAQKEQNFYHYAMFAILQILRSPRGDKWQCVSLWMI